MALESVMKTTVLYREVQRMEGTSTVHCYLSEKERKDTQILFPELIYYSKKEEGQDIITIAFEDEDEIDWYLGKNPQSVRSTAVGMNNGEICSVQIDMDNKGNFYIAPVEDNEGFNPDGNHVGMFATTFTFLPNDMRRGKLILKKMKILQSQYN